MFGGLLYGLLSGFAEFLPISSDAHGILYCYLTGYCGVTPFVRLMVYLGALMAIVASCWSRLVHIRRELYLVSLPKKRRKRMPDLQAVSDFRLVMTGTIPMILGLILQNRALRTFSSLPWLSILLIMSGIFLYLCQFLRDRNRDSKEMNRPEGLLLGGLCALSVIPGLSRIALFTYFSRRRGCSRVYSMELALLFSIPLLLGMLLVQLVCTFAAGSAVLANGGAIAGILACIGSFAAAMAGIRLMRYFAVKMDFTGFSHYCWGLSVFCFIYYLMT